MPHRQPRTGPSKPPVMKEFKEEVSRLVSAYVEAKAAGSGGVFLVTDTDGSQLKLTRPSLKGGQIRNLPNGQVAACVFFADASGGARGADLDFILSKESGDWTVAKLFVHAVGGSARYDYDPDNRIVAAASATRPQNPAAPRASRSPRPTAPPRLAVKVAFVEPSGNDILDGGETAEIRVTVSNSGTGEAYGVSVAAAMNPAAKGLSLPAPAELGNIRPGKSASARLTVSAAESAPDRTARVSVETREANGFDAEASVLEFEIRAYRPPRLEVAGLELEGAAVVKAGEPTKFKATLRNAGASAARGVSARLVIDSPDIFPSGEESVSLGVLPPGETKTASFEFFVNKRFKGGKALPLWLELTHAGPDGPRPEKAPLSLALGKTPDAPKVLSIKGRQELPAPAGEPASALEEPPASRTPKNPDAYGVVIGIERYRDVPPVSYAASDARTVYAYLTQSMGFDPKNVILLEDDRAALTDIDTYLGPWLSDRVGPKSKVFVFYAGHGAPNPKTGEAYLIPFDGNPNYVETKAYPIRKLYEGLSKLPSRDVTVALDACFSGAGGRSVLAKGARPLVQMGAPVPAGDNLVILTASGPDQISTFHEEGRHGLLTYFLLKGLRGEGDSDKDGRVTTGELFSYLKPAVEREARLQHVEQVPTLTPAPENLGERADGVWLRLK